MLSQRSCKNSIIILTALQRIYIIIYYKIKLFQCYLLFAIQKQAYLTYSCRLLFSWV
jgi:hypothetical protein